MEAVIAIAVVLSIVAIGSIVYATTEGLFLVDAVYFTVVTATTVGFGDYVPDSELGKVCKLY